MSDEILHISGCEKFLPTFVELINDKYDSRKHIFLLTRGMSENDLDGYSNVIIAKGGLPGLLKHYVIRAIKIQNAKKVILHNLFDDYLIFLLFLMPWNLKKCYWVIWGADLYKYLTPKLTFKEKFIELIRRKVLKNIGNLVTYIEGDVQLARKWYNAKGKYHECFMYTSNLYKEYDVPQKQHSGINILLGNSADPSNNHIDAFDKIETFKEQDIKIYVPLSYGNPDYAKMIIEQGKRRFGEKFEALTEYMPFNKYLEFLGKIDIAIFNHKRQQAMGNSITLLGLGKKVYIRSDVTQWGFFKSHGIVVYDIEKFMLESTKDNNLNKNRIYLSNFMNKDNLYKQLDYLFKN